MDPEADSMDPRQPTTVEPSNHSGIGASRPTFVSHPQTGGTATPPNPMLSAAQFGALPNWGE